MCPQIKKIIKHSAIYGIFNVSSQAINLILIPIYTRYLVPGEYGALEIFVVTNHFLAVFLSLGLNSALIKHYSYYPQQKYKRLVANTALLFAIGFSSICVLGLCFASNFFAVTLLGNARYTFFFQILFLTLFFNNISIIPLAIFRVREESVIYSVLLLLSSLIRLSLNIYFVVLLKKGVSGILLGGLISTAVLAISCILLLSKDIKWEFSLERLKGLLHFGLPLVPAGLAGFILTMSDRYFLKIFCDLHEVGLYSLGYRVSSAIGLAIGAFQLAWGPILFSLEKEKNAQEIYARVLTYFILLCGFMTLAVSLFGREIIMLISTPAYYRASQVIPLIASAYLLNGIYFVVAVGINLKNKTIYFTYAMATAAVLNLVLNYMLIPKYGMMGAAIATLISYFIAALGIFCSSVRFYPIEYEWKRIGKIILVGIGLYMLSSLVNFNGLWKNAMLKLLLFALFPFLLYLMKFFYPSELNRITKYIRLSSVLEKQ